MPSAKPTTEEQWRHWLEHGHGSERFFRRFFGLMPSNPHCRMCHAPFGGLGGKVMSLFGKGPFAKNPSFCAP